jgi:hypothetical protein
MTEDIVFVELDAEESASDKPHCGDCEMMAEPAPVDVVDKPHCEGCD